MARSARRAGACSVLVALLTSLLSLVAPAPAGAVSPDIVVSQVYGGGGNSGAPLTHDFVELYNRGGSPVDLTGWSVQYASATGTGTFAANSPTALVGTLPPGEHYLVQLAGGANGVALPTPDATGTTNMAGAAGKVVAVRPGASLGLECNGLSDPCDAAETARIADLVGYGTANYFETAPAPALSNTTAALRAAAGATDTDNNSADFTAASPAPRTCGAACVPPPPACDPPPSVEIAAIQGSGTSTPIAGSASARRASSPATSTAPEASAASTCRTTPRRRPGHLRWHLRRLVRRRRRRRPRAGRRHRRRGVRRDPDHGHGRRRHRERRDRTDRATTSRARRGPPSSPSKGCCSRSRRR